ncbi:MULTISPECIES: hypothetical protein [unclassified Acidovorax]|uniref:hypothetical protein n=1 Tax=unclassified Acidovorax TaxID=2684926 RepID=UPI0028832795|nr:MULTISPECIES: hypothetical protein [unclassified Acidovorax]
MQRRGFENDEGTFLLDLVKIAMGVFIGGLAAMFAYEAITAWRVEQAAKRAVAELQRETDRIRSQERQRAQQAEQAKREEAERTAQQRVADEQASRALRERRERKEAAWQRFYQQSDSCRHDSATAPCANEYMAARKRFEASYIDR